MDKKKKPFDVTASSVSGINRQTYRYLSDTRSYNATMCFRQITAKKKN